MYDKYSGRSRRFAFVTMSSVEDASAAIEKLNGSVSFISRRPLSHPSALLTDFNGARSASRRSGGARSRST